MSGLKYIYILYVASAGLNFIISIFVKNTSLRAPKKDVVIEAESGTETEMETPMPTPSPKTMTPQGGQESDKQITFMTEYNTEIKV